MIVVLRINVRYEWVLAALHTCNLIINSFRLFVMLRVSKTLSQRTSLSFIMPSLTVSEWELRAHHAASDGWLAIRVYIASLVSSTHVLSSLWPLLSVFWGPTFTVVFVRSCVTREVPSWVHHCLEVHIIIDRSRDISIVFNEFFQSHSEVSLIFMHGIMMCFECFQEFSQYLLFSLSSFKHCWMLLGIVHTNQVLNFNDTTSISI